MELFIDSGITQRGKTRYCIHPHLTFGSPKPQVLKTLESFRPVMEKMCRRQLGDLFSSLTTLKGVGLNLEVVAGTSTLKKQQWVDLKGWIRLCLATEDP